MNSSNDSQRCAISRLNASESTFAGTLTALIDWDSVSNSTVENVVREIIGEIRSHGDSALLQYTNRFDRRTCADVEELCIAPEEMHKALESIDEDTRQAWLEAAKRIEDYHRHQVQESWSANNPYRASGYLRARRQGKLPLIGFNECHTCASCRC